MDEHVKNEAHEFNVLLDRLAEARSTTIELLGERMKARGLTAMPICHLWYDEATDRVEIRAGAAPDDGGRPTKLKGLDLNLALKIQGTLRRDRATEAKLGVGRKVYYIRKGE